jgi:hypothetical protein
MTKPLGIGCTIYKVAEKAKRLKVYVNAFATKLEQSHLVSRAQNALKLLYSIMIHNTISLPYKVGPIKLMVKGFSMCKDSLEFFFFFFM